MFEKVWPHMHNAATRSTVISIPILCCVLLPLGPWTAAVAQCYQFSSGVTASLTVNITNLPRPTISSDAHGTVVYDYDLRGLHGNSARVIAGGTVSSSGDFPVINESPNESTLSIRITYGRDAGTTFEASVASNDKGPMQAVAFLHAPSDPGHPKGLLPDGLPPVLPPPSAWSKNTSLAVTLSRQRAYLPASGKIDAIRSCTGAPNQPPPSPQTCGPLPDDRVNRPQSPPRDWQAVGPFNVRDAFLLEYRLQNERDAAHFSAGHGENLRQNLAPSPAQPFIPDADNLDTYRDVRWVGIVKEVDQLKEMGGFKVAETRYLNILDKVTTIHGPCSDPVAFMLIHLGEFYLETRDFDRAYAFLSQGSLARRHRLGELQGDELDVERLALMSVLTLLGKLDLGRGNLDKAEEELAEATAICNSKSLLQVATGLNTLYYRSLVLETQGKWKTAEDLWLQSVKARSDIAAIGVYVDCVKEAAAFYARQGAIQKAATLAQKALEARSAAAKRAREAEDDVIELDAPHIRTFRYQTESDLAMKEIMALDAWQRSGPSAAAAILVDPDDREISSLVRFGVDADRVRLLAWAKRRAALHMSILLDGDSSGKNVERAYKTLISVKGSFIASQSDFTRKLEHGWYNPHIDAPSELALLNQLGQIRTYHAHLVMPAILGAGSVDQPEIASVERTEAAILATLATVSPPIGNGIPALPVLEPDAAMIDFVEWQRTDRRTLALMPSEYGAFVTTGRAPVRFVRLGPASEIIPDIELLSKKGQGSAAIKQLLRRLYGKLITPLDPLLPHAPLRGVPRIFVVPDGTLTLVPIAALLGPDDRYFLADHRVAYLVDSQAIYSEWMGPAWAVSQPVVLGNPDFTMALNPAEPSPSPWPEPFIPLWPEKDFGPEAVEVATALGLPPDHLLLGKMAREEVLRGILGPKLLHLATHSKGNIDWHEPAVRWELFEYPPLLSSQNPFLRSYIALAGANLEQAGPEDGLLTALEVLSLHLEGTQLVVLSSCEAGKGKTVDGLGLTGMRGAFWQAGAKGLVTDLWKEYGAAGRQLMSSFYRHLGDAGGPAEALRQAQLEMIKSTEYADPIYWAGFSYSGLSEPVQLSLPGGETPWKDSESLVEPSCIEVSAHFTIGNWSMRDRLRIKIGSLVRLDNKSSGEAVYQLFAPGSDVEDMTSDTIGNSMPVAGVDGRVASKAGDQIFLTVQRSTSESSVIIQTRSKAIVDPVDGVVARPSAPIYTVRLKGGPELFASFAIPKAFPPLSAYREATIEGVIDKTKTLQIDSVQYCGSDLPTQ